MHPKFLFIVYFIFCLATPAMGATIGDVTFPDQVIEQDHNLTINGVAMRTFTFFDVYAAALYVDTPSSDSATILQADAPRLMTMHFERSVDAKKITGAWQEGLEANTPGADDGLRARFAQLGAMMEDMDKGQDLECVYLPGKGTTVRVKGAVKGVIEGKDFNDALLACWIGPKPGPGEKFKTGLLGK